MGREPTLEEIAEKMGMSLDKVQKVFKVAKGPFHSKRLLARRRVAG